MKTTELQELFLREKSFENYTDHSVLEVLLQTARVRGDIPLMVNNLYDAFGSTKGILEARPEQLMSVPAVNQQAATIISMVAPLARVWERCNIDDPGKICTSKDAEAYCKSLLMGERAEQFYVIALNTRNRIIGIKKTSEGTLDEVHTYPRRIVEMTLNYNAAAIIIAHNHPGGTCGPSSEDIVSSLSIQHILNRLGIYLLDHIIVAGSNAYSMRAHGDLMPPEIKKTTKPKKDSREKKSSEKKKPQPNTTKKSA